jgi:hypothetical protein
MIASTLVELAARHGQTRNLTQVTSINSRHKGSWASPNRPVDIVQFGQDLTAELYQHPFVTFFSDDSSAATQTLGGLQSGFVLPWADNPNTNSPRYQTDTARLKRDTFLAQQLRYCLHLWDFDLVQRPKLPLHVELARFLPREFGFSFSLQDTAGAVDAGIYDHWDYGDPWGQLPPNNPTVSRLLNAAEVVQSLGSTQLCPAPGSPQNEFDCKGNQFSPTNDLEPDLYAYLAHQLGPLQSYPSPGLFHPVDNSNVPVTNENDISSVQPMYRAPNSIPAYPAKSVVVIITTKGLRDPPASPYHQSLKGAVQALNTLGRPVIIVFIPATGADSNTTPNFCEILRRGNTCSSPELGAENNRLFLLSPYAADYGQFYIGSTEGATFINYWEDLLINSTNKSQDLYAASIAETIFLDAITGLTPKL